MRDGATEEVGEIGNLACFLAIDGGLRMVLSMSFAQAEAEIPKFSATQQERLLAMLARLAAEREENWDEELRRRHTEMMRGKKISEDELLQRAGMK